MVMVELSTEVVKTTVMVTYVGGGDCGDCYGGDGDCGGKDRSGASDWRLVKPVLRENLVTCASLRWSTRPTSARDKRSPKILSQLSCFFGTVRKLIICVIVNQVPKCLVE